MTTTEIKAKLSIEGMSCVSCVATINKAKQALPHATSKNCACFSVDTNRSCKESVSVFVKNLRSI